METLDIGGRLVGRAEPPYVIAEIGSNHNGDMALCRQLIDAAKECGADAVKFQSWSKSSLISKAEYARNTQYTDRHKHFGTLEAMVERYQLTPDQHVEAAAYCRKKGIAFLSSCFSPGEVDLLTSMGVPCFKVASMDVNNLPLLEYVAGKGKPVLLSTGMADLGEIENALGVLRGAGSGPVALLHCVSVYPTPAELVNLRNIPMLGETFSCPVGFSDHSLGVAVAISAVVLGAVVIEKHFTLDKTMAGWDHGISADPGELAAIVKGSREAHLALGSAERRIGTAEMEKRKTFRRSLVAKRDLAKGHRLEPGDIDFKRPGAGIRPDELSYVVGRALVRDKQADDVFGWDDFV